MKHQLLRVFAFIMSRLYRSQWMKDAFYQNRKSSVRFKWFGKAKIYFDNIGIELEEEAHFALVSGYDYAEALQKQRGATFKRENQDLYIHLEGLKIKIRRPVELYILHEIFVLGEYRFNNNQDFIIIDIGMNVGLASLYFAKNEQIKAVYAYEPIPAIYQEALENFNLNEPFNDKIKAFNQGLGKKVETIQFHFDDVHIGNTTKAGNEARGKNISKITAQVLNAQDTIQNIAAQHSDTNIAIKIDCEGMEFDIFEAFTQPIPDNVKLFMMEWHFKQPDSIIETLTQNGFTVITNEREHNLGMIYAHR